MDFHPNEQPELHNYLVREAIEHDPSNQPKQMPSGRFLSPFQRGMILGFLLSTTIIYIFSKRAPTSAIQWYLLRYYQHRED